MPEDIMAEETLELRELSVGYGKKTVLHRLNMVFARDNISFVAGANGVGKSLLLKTLAGFIVPQHGAVIGIQQQLPALMHQKPILLNRSVLENLRFIALAEKNNAEKNNAEKNNAKIANRKIDNELIDDVLMQAGLFEARQKNAYSLSVGQQKLLSFASMMVMRRDYWLLDEPTASLAPDMKNRIEQLIIKARQRGQKMVIVSHDMAQIKLLAKDKDDILFLFHCDVHQDMVTADGVAMQPMQAMMQVSDFFKRPPNAQAQQFINGKG